MAETLSRTSPIKTADDKTVVEMDIGGAQDQMIMNLFPVANEKRTKLCFWTTNPEDTINTNLRPLSIETHGLADPLDSVKKHVTFYTAGIGDANVKVFEWYGETKQTINCILGTEWRLIGILI